MIRLFSFTLLLIALTVALWTPTQAQNTPNKKANLIPDTDAPWGLVIEFVEQTTVAQEKALRETYNLILTPGGYHYADPHPYIGQTFDAALYSGKEEYHYYSAVHYRGDTELAACLAADTCPPLFVENVWYEPVDTATELALIAEKQIALLDNQRTTPFFFLKLIECWIEQRIHSDHQCTVITPWA